nr:MAG TPA: tail tape measure protein [Caudoviricetes sp.]
MAVAGSLTYDTNIDKSGFEKGLNSLKNSTQNVGTKIKNIVVALGIDKIISATMNTIKNSVNDAVSRIDTLNNYPKVMKNLGISSEESEASIKKLSEKLTGLPTTLDSASLAVQRFTSKNSDIEKSTDYFLALNNALLAGGASADIQSSAMEQLSQAYAKGKPDMMEWRSLQTAMPAQLNQVAKAFNMTSDELGEALRNGKISMDDFMDKIVELNENGTGEFQSFEEQAKNSTGGIATSITNMKTAITRGVSEIVKSIDKLLDSIGLGGISNVLNQIGKESEGILKNIANVLNEIAENGISSVLETAKQKGPEIITNLVNGIVSKIPDIISTISNILIQFIQVIIANLPAIISGGVQIISALITGIAQQLPTLIPMALELILTLVTSLLDNIDQLIDAGINLIIGLAEGLINAIPILIEKIPIIIEKLINAIVNNLPKIIQMGITLIVKLAEGLIKAIPQLVSKIPQIIGALVSGFGQFLRKMNEVGKNLVDGIWNGIKNAKDWLLGKVKEWCGNILNGIKAFFGIHSPSRVMRDEIGKRLPQGVAVGIEADTDEALKAIDNMNNDIMSEMNKAVAFETGSINANASVKSNNSMLNVIQATFNIDGSVEIDGQKTGRILTPYMTKTLKTGGAFA